MNACARLEKYPLDGAGCYGCFLGERVFRYLGLGEYLQCRVDRTWAERVVKKEASVYARVTNIKFPPAVGTELVRVAQGLTPILKKQRGFDGLQVLTDPNAGEGIIRSCQPACRGGRHYDERFHCSR